MARRRGQNGGIERKGNYYYVRIWEDQVGTEKRKHTSIYLGPATGPNKLNKATRLRLAKAKVEESRVNSAERFRQIEEINHGIRFRQQANSWLLQLRKRKRKPVKKRSIKNWESHLKYINDKIGDVPLALVNNAVLRDLVTTMVEEKLPTENGEEPKLRYKAKTIRNYAQVVKMVLASAIDNNGEPLYPRKWNEDFIDLPSVKHKDQKTPSFAGDQITKIVSEASGQMGVFYATLAGSGVRVGECSGLEVKHFRDNTLLVEQQVWNNDLEEPKTKAGFREVDVDPALGALIREHIGNRKTGFIFPNQNGGPLHQSDVLRRNLHPILAKLGIEKQGFHGFRRYRVSHLRKNRVPENLIRFWVGHSNRSVTDLYDMVQADVEFRRSTAASVGLGFDISGVKTAANEVICTLKSGFVPYAQEIATASEPA